MMMIIIIIILVMEIIIGLDQQFDINHNDNDTQELFSYILVECDLP